MKKQTLLAAAILGCSTLPLLALAAEPIQTPTKAEVKQYAGDAALTTKVKSAFLAEPDLKSLAISVETTNGVVVLSGAVISTAQIEQAVDIARHVKGVKEVKNDLRLKSDLTG